MALVALAVVLAGVAAQAPSPEVWDEFALTGSPVTTGVTRPCQPVHVSLATDTRTPPEPWQVSMVATSVALVASASGVPVVFDGVVSEHRERRRDGRGAHAAFHVVLTSHPAPVTREGDTWAGSASVDALPGRRPWHGRWPSGVVTVYRDALTPDQVADDGTNVVVVHELGHLLGLDHAPHGVMAAVPSYAQGLDAGTRAGLAAVGCHP